MNMFKLPEPYVLGFDFSGDGVRLGGEGKDALKVGDRVFGRTGAGGCFAEYVVTDRENVVLRGAVPAPEAST
jgi:NADPH:quinone reductase